MEGELKMNYIPHAKGLTEELSSRVPNLVIGQPTERMAPAGMNRLTCYEVFDGDNRLGVLEVNSWYGGSVTQIAHVAYEGVVPGYNNGKKISMTATELPTLDVSDPEYLHYLQLRNFTEPNNTPLNPLYRHDGHSLRLADHEVDGKKRVVLSEEKLAKLEKVIAGLL